jgi:transcriptional regulator with PAS, ATPase and Fis domain
VMRQFVDFRWPGNVRELRNTLESMMVLADGEMLTEKDLPDRIRESATVTGSSKDLPIGLTMEELEKMAITQALSASSGNRTHAAQKLNISVRTLQRKLRQYELERKIDPQQEDDVLTEA